MRHSCFAHDHRPAVLALAAGVALAAMPALAQDRLFIGTGEIGAFGRFGERIGTAPGVVHGRLVDGGRYVVAGVEFETSPPVFDTRTGGIVATPPGRVIDVDPIRPRIFVVSGTQVSVWDLERQLLTPLLQVPQDATGFVPATMGAYAPHVDELFVWSRGVDTRVSVVDVARGQEVRTLSLDNQFALSWRVTPDGARVVVPYTGSGRLALYDGRTGALLTTQQLADLETPTYDVRFDRWYHASRSALTVLDRNFSVLVSLPLEVPSCGSTAAVSLHTDRLYLVHGVGRSGSSTTIPMRLPLTVFDTATGRVVGGRDVKVAAGIPAGTLRCQTAPVSVLTAPGPPRGLSAAVSGRSVTLSWTRVGDATDFVLDVGLAAGRSDVRFGVGPAASVTFADVPPGTYYLRILGTNAFGVSRRSNEVVVTVP